MMKKIKNWLKKNTAPTHRWVVDKLLAFKQERAALAVLKWASIKYYPWSKDHIALYLGATPSVKKAIALANVLFETKNHTTARKVLRSVLDQDIPDASLPYVALIFGRSNEFRETDAKIFDTLERLSKKKVSNKLFRTICAWILTSRIEFDEKVALIDMLRQSSAAKGNPEYWKGRLNFIHFQLRVEQNEIVDVREFLPPAPYSAKVARALLPFFPVVKRQGYEDVAFELINSLPRASTAQKVDFAIAMAQNFPDQAPVDDLLLAETPTQMFKTTGITFPMRGAGQDWSVAFETALNTLIDAYPSLPMSRKNQLIGQLVKFDMYLEARALLDQYPDATGLIVFEKSLLGRELYEAGRFAESFDAYMEAWLEFPGQEDALTGMRFSAVRSGRDFGTIVTLQKRLFEEGTYSNAASISTNMLWHLRTTGRPLQASLERHNTPIYLMLKKAFGDRILVEEDFRSLSPKASIFLLDHNGVGDLIRISQIFGALAEHFEDISAVCDPRLVNIFSRSFPRIKLIPCWGLRRGVVGTESRDQDRIVGFNGLFRNYLTVQAGEVMSASDYIATRGYMEYLICEPFAHTKRPQGGYLLPRTEDAGHAPYDGNRPLRVGLLWRSSLLLSRRKNMYLAIEDFAPILRMDGVEFHSVQHHMADSERDFCLENGVVVHDDVDLYDDFDGMSDLLASLDLVVGISSVPAELAAALGVKVWFLGFSPENYLLRTGGGQTEIDQITVNAINFSAPDIDFSEPLEVCIDKTMAETRRRLENVISAKKL